MNPSLQYMMMEAGMNPEDFTGSAREVRAAIAEELVRREPRDQLVPIDRDAVPSRYQELVRRYYEALGSDE